MSKESNLSPCPLQYYFDPVSNRRFRSKIEVLYFLETGTLRKRKKSLDGNPTVSWSYHSFFGTQWDIPIFSSIFQFSWFATLQSTDGSEEPKSKKSSSNAKTAPLNFDFFNVPERVEWVLTDPSKDAWTPFIDNEKVPECTKREWVGAFQLLGRSKVWRQLHPFWTFFGTTYSGKNHPPSLPPSL